MIHQHSILAWHARHLRADAARLLRPLRGIGRAATDREIRDAISSRHDMNFVRPRITEALDASIMEGWSVVCPVTGRTVRLVWFAAEPVQPEQGKESGCLC